MLKRGGIYSIVGYGGTVENSTSNMVGKELTIIGNMVGTYNELAELMELNRQGKVNTTFKMFPLSDAAGAMEMLDRGEILGRGILTPGR